MVMTVFVVFATIVAAGSTARTAYLTVAWLRLRNRLRADAVVSSLSTTFLSIGTALDAPRIAWQHPHGPTPASVWVCIVLGVAALCFSIWYSRGTRTAVRIAFRAHVAGRRK